MGAGMERVRWQLPSCLGDLAGSIRGVEDLLTLLSVWYGATREYGLLGHQLRISILSLCGMMEVASF